MQFINRNVVITCFLLASAGNLLSKGTPPVLTAVTPNPLTVGTVQVAITGSGFLTGALVYDSYGKESMIQTSPDSVSTGTILVTIYQGSAASSTFCVKNPGTACSNSITVPVGSQSPGSGSGGSSGSGGGGLSSAPVLTSVTPSPLPVGTDQIAINGSGFVSGALVYYSYGNQSMIQTNPDSVSAGTVVVTIYQGAAATSTFCVKNPGTACSNSITVPVTSQTAGGSGSGGSGGSGTGGGSGSGGGTPPVLTSVTPNPLPVGTDQIAINGTGFVSGALVYDSYGIQSMIQTSPDSVNAGTVLVTIYQGAATSSTFCVKNPGTACSNSITVPVSGSSSGSGSPGSGSGNSTYTLTVVNGTLANGATSGSFAAGTSVAITAGTPPAGEAFQTWSGAQVANAQGAATTLSMPGQNTTVTASFYTPPPIPFPVTTHPRLWITQQDLPRLQSWATPGNVAYQGQLGPLYTAIGNYNLAFPGAPLNALNPTPASPFPDPGDVQGYDSMLTEENAFILAFNSLIDPSATNRASYAQAARNLIMYAMNQAALGPLANAPFRDPGFPTYNRGSFSVWEYPLIVDWIYPILSAQDKATIQTVFLLWANACVNADTTGGDNPGNPAILNSLALFPEGQPNRYASNNYFLAHARLLTLMSLVLDPADDPSINPAAPAAALGNSLRSYIADSTGAWLYEEFAMMGDPATVAQAYGMVNNPTGAGFGLSSGGLPPEGTLYGESFFYALAQLWALETSGFNNVAYSGPQIGLIGAPVWDRFVTGYQSSLTPTSRSIPDETWLGPVFQIAGYGDMLRLWQTPDQMQPFAALALLEQEQGIATHSNAARWYALNVMPNGAGGLESRMTNPWTWGVTQDILYYMLLDPNAPAPTDPRPTFPTLFYDPPAGRIVAHTDWTASGTMFDYRASWITINHQDGAGGEFGFFRKGEWLTKEMSNYDAGGNGDGSTVTYHNTLGIQNWCAVCSTFAWGGIDISVWNNGGQWMEGENAGDPVTVMSSGPGYVFANSNLANLYNKPHGEDYQINGNWAVSDPISDVTQANRSILWLNNDYVVIYDRATTGHSGYKKFNLSMATSPVVSGNTATETMADGQQLFVQTLLPSSPSQSSFNGAALLNPVADTEPMMYIYQVRDPSNPPDARLLHVLQGADAGASMAPATHLQSTSGTAFDGAQFGANEVWFPVNQGAFGGSAFPVSAGVSSLLITGLAPNAGYSVTVQGSTVSVFPNGTSATADSAGVLLVSF